MTGIVTLACLLFWAGLCVFQNKTSAVSFHRLITIVFIAGLIARIVFALYTPVFYAPDEQSHYNYIKYIYEKKELPVQTTRTGDPSNEWEYHQAPLYYIALAPIYGLSAIFFKNRVPIQVIILRTFSILLWIMNVLLAFRIVKRLIPEDIFLKTFTICMVCLLPTYTFISSVINNDNLLFTLGSAILYMLLKERSRTNSMLIGILLGLALLTKFTAVFYVIAIIAMLFMQSWKKVFSYKRAVSYLIIIFLIALVIWSPWAYRVYKVYGEITAEKATNITAQWSSRWYAIIYTLNYMKESFWAVAGIYNNIRFFPFIGILVTYFSIAGLLYGLLFKRKLFNALFTNDSLTYIYSAGITIVAAIILIIEYGILYGQGQGRYLFTMLTPIGILIAAGIRLSGITKHSDNPSLHVVGFFITYMVSFLTYSIVAFSHL